MFKRILTLLLVLALAMTFVSGAFAATANPGPSLPGYQLVTFSTNSITENATGVWKFKAPWPFRILNLSTSARAATGTTPTLTIDVTSNGATMLSSAATVTTLSITDATLISNPTVTDEQTVSFNATVGGTTPAWADVTVLMVIKRQ